MLTDLIWYSNRGHSELLATDGCWGEGVVISLWWHDHWKIVHDLVDGPALLSMWGTLTGLWVTKKKEEADIRWKEHVLGGDGGASEVKGRCHQDTLHTCMKLTKISCWHWITSNESSYTGTISTYCVIPSESIYFFKKSIYLFSVRACVHATP